MIPALADLIVWLEPLGVFVFALTGALVAARKELDPVGFVFIATVTGVGGGTLRDLLLGRAPVFWVADPTSLVVAFTAAVLAFIAARRLESVRRLLLWADALGLAVAAAIGVQAAMAVGVHSSVAVLMGVMTGCFGGLIRDIICNELPLLLRKEIYATAALAGSLCQVGLVLGGLHADAATLIAVAVTFATRAVGLLFGLSLPAYHLPGRTG